MSQVELFALAHIFRYYNCSFLTLDSVQPRVKTGQEVVMSNGGGSGGGGGGSPLDAASAVVDVVKGASEFTDGNITYQFDKQTKIAKKEPEDCECPEPIPTRATFRTIKYVHFTGLYDLARIRLGVSWEYNGCDVIGAIGSPGSSVARLGWSIDVKMTALDTGKTVPPTCECCRKAVCAKFQYIVTIDPPFQGTRLHNGEVWVCGDGSPPHHIRHN